MPAGEPPLGPARAAAEGPPPRPAPSTLALRSCSAASSGHSAFRGETCSFYSVTNLAVLPQAAGAAQRFWWGLGSLAGPLVSPGRLGLAGQRLDPSALTVRMRGCGRTRHCWRPGAPVSLSVGGHCSRARWLLAQRSFRTLPAACAETLQETRSPDPRGPGCAAGPPGSAALLGASPGDAPGPPQALALWSRPRVLGAAGEPGGVPVTNGWGLGSDRGGEFCPAAWCGSCVRSTAPLAYRGPQR